ncbi:MAG: hypothetical protein PHS44_02750 [Candidatus Dojkabacteria bacterium]|nr:hypothetical protein [Candidatus Dojkabacteria bacterium]
MSKFEASSHGSDEYTGYYERLALVLAEYAEKGRYDRYFYGVTDDLEVVETIMKDIIDARGNECRLFCRESCTNLPTDQHFLIIIDMYYQSSTHTVLFAAQKPLDPASLFFLVDACICRIEVYKRQAGRMP